MIRHTVFDSHHGQTDERLYVMDEGKLLAYLDYSVYQGEPSIKMIKSMDPRKGYARALVLALQAEYPETEIDWGMLTDDGAALKHSLRFKEIVDPVMKGKSDLLTRVKAKLADLEAKASADTVRDFGDLWNRLYDMERRLEDELEHAKVSKLIIVG